MALKTGGGLETVSLVLTTEQARELRRIRDDRKRTFNRVSVSDVAREVVAVGLRVISFDSHSDSVASRENDTKSEAA